MLKNRNTAFRSRDQLYSHAGADSGMTVPQESQVQLQEINRKPSLPQQPSAGVSGNPIDH